MRIEGELLKVGIGVSATTIATVLRSSGLGPAPRRIGPSWSEFLRAQAHSLLDGDPRPALGDHGREDDAREPSAPAPDGEPREVEADNTLFRADAAEPRSASHPLPVRSRSAPPRQRVLAATRAPLRPVPSLRTRDAETKGASQESKACGVSKLRSRRKKSRFAGGTGVLKPFTLVIS
jgi:hypothetical protein